MCNFFLKFRHESFCQQELSGNKGPPPSQPPGRYQQQQHGQWGGGGGYHPNGGGGPPPPGGQAPPNDMPGMNPPPQRHRASDWDQGRKRPRNEHGGDPRGHGGRW